MTRGYDMQKESQQRLAWVDYAKGIAIILVVVSHVTGGLRTRGIIPENAAQTYLTNWIYAFHMPVFFVVAGLFARTSMRHGLQRFVLAKLGVIAYPYVLWTVILSCCQMLMSRYTNLPPDLLWWRHMFYAPTETILWFLYSLFAILIAFGLATRVGAGPPAFAALAAAAFSMSQMGWLQWWPGIATAALFGIYFALGVVAKEHLGRWTQDRPPAHLAGVAVLSFVCLSLLVVAGVDQQPWLKPVPAFLGIVGVFAISLLLGRRDALPWLRFCGVVSLPIYLLHMLCAAAVRIFLDKALHLEGMLLHVLVGVPVGLLAPILIYQVCNRYRFPYLFKIPMGAPGTAAPGPRRGSAFHVG